MESKLKGRKSSVWSYFTPINSEFAKCDMCGTKCSYKSSITNLKKHIVRKHPTIRLGTTPAASSAPSTSQVNELTIEDVDDPTAGGDTAEQLSSSGSKHTLPAFFQSRPNINRPTIEEQTDEQQQGTSVSNKTAKSTQGSIVSYMQQKMTAGRRKNIENSLVMLFTKDLLPFSLVEGKGFREFCRNLNPSYVLPDRHTVSKTLIPSRYEACCQKVRELLLDAKKVSLTTDTWTSMNNESYLAVTCHFIDSEFVMQNILLECAVLTDRHTSKNIADELSRIVNKWGLQQKVSLVVSDNASNMKKAIKDILKWKHFGCFAHTLNLIVQAGIQLVSSLIEKISAIVAYFKRSSSSNELFLKYQRNTGREPKKLLQQVVTRWNSVYYMLKRFVELEDAVKSTWALLDKPLEDALTPEEWKIAGQLCDVLEPFEDVTKMTSGENYMTASMVIVLVKGLQDVCSTLLSGEYFQIVKDVIATLKEEVEDRFQTIENNITLGICTLLDPRFKTLGFSDTTNMESCKRNLTNLLAGKLPTRSTPSTSSSMGTTPETSKVSVWASFEKKVANTRPVGTRLSRSIIELDRYFEVDVISRSDDPLLWWKEQRHNFPHLAEIVREWSCAVATSVPCERLFSKTGQIINERRTRLKAKKLNEILFLNVNKKF